METSEALFLPTYRANIRHARAYPAACPVCGLSTELKAGDPPVRPVTLNELFKRHYGIWRVDRVEREAPWVGFHTWEFVCYHVDPFMRQIYQPSFIDKIAKKNDWHGRSFNIPITFSDSVPADTVYFVKDDKLAGAIVNVKIVDETDK